MNFIECDFGSISLRQLKFIVISNDYGNLIQEKCSYRYSTVFIKSKA